MLTFKAPKPRVNVPTEARFCELVIALDASISPELAADLYRLLNFRNPVFAVASVKHVRRHGGALEPIAVQEWLEPLIPYSVSPSH